MSEQLGGQLQLETIQRRDAILLQPGPDGKDPLFATIPAIDGGQTHIVEFDEVAERMPNLSVVANLIEHGAEAHPSDTVFEDANNAVRRGGAYVVFRPNQTKPSKSGEGRPAARIVRLLEFVRDDDGSVLPVVVDTQGEEKVLPDGERMLYVDPHADALGAAARRSLGKHSLAHAG